MKKLNIFINEKIKIELKALSKKYELSISTIIDILLDELFIIGIQKKYDLKNQYIDKSEKIQTTIKPKNYIETMQKWYKNIKEGEIARTISNIIYIYYSEEIYKYFSKDKIQKIKQKIGNRLSNTKETRWNYNNELRRTIRVVKGNKDYFKRILGD